jgi:hypothetical protein
MLLTAFIFRFNERDICGANKRSNDNNHSRFGHPFCREARTMVMTTKKKAPWKKAAPRKNRHTTLTSASKAKAKASAKRAGRKYPNLVDNMNAAKKQRPTTSKKRSRK